MGEKVSSSQVCIRWVEKYDEYGIKEHNIIIYSHECICTARLSVRSILC